MKRKTILKTLLFGTLLCTVHSMGLASSTQSSLSERTDIGVAFSQMKGENFTTVGTPTNGRWSYVTDRSDTTKNKVQFHVETLQPIGHYDAQTSKNVFFVQGRLTSNGGEKRSTRVHYEGAQRSPVYYDIFHNITTEKLGTIGNAGFGYRRLSSGEHSYIGVNAFYDHAFKDSYKRGSVGAEYVTGENKVYGNLYRNLSGTTSAAQSDSQTLLLRGESFSYSDPYLVHIPEYTDARVANGYDIGYERTFTNARWIKANVEYYHWDMKNQNRNRIDLGWGYPDYPMNYLNRHPISSISGINIGTQLQLTPHIGVEVGYNKTHNFGGSMYGQILYTLGKKEYAYIGGKHSSDTVTTARYRMLDKVRRSNDIVVDEYYEIDYLGLARPNQL